MRILLTNDDGINASGIQALCKELQDIADLTVVAPDSEKSASSQAITVHHPIRVDKHNLQDYSILAAWRVAGTPTDCVKIALEELMPEKPDLVISGINHGPNLGTDILYSGTVSAAIEASLHGVPSVAVSLDSWEGTDFQASTQFIRRLVPKMMQNSLPPNTLLNVNVPMLSEKEIKGVAITKLGVRTYKNTFEGRTDPRGRLYYWMGGNIIEQETDDDAESDIRAVREGFISVTPVHFDLTHYSIMNSLAKWGL